MMNLPPDLQALADRLSAQSPEVRELVRYALVLAMLDDEKARVVDTRREGESEVWQVETVAKDQFEIVCPPISEALEKTLLEEIRRIVQDQE